jgi:hypothetical protein
VTGTGAQPGDTASRSPWGDPGPDGAWWHGDAAPGAYRGPEPGGGDTAEMPAVTDLAGPPGGAEAARSARRERQDAAAPAARDARAERQTGEAPAAARNGRAEPSTGGRAEAPTGGRAEPSTGGRAEAPAGGRAEVSETRSATVDPAVPSPAQPADDEPAFWMPVQEIPRDAGAAWPSPQMRAGLPHRAYGWGVAPGRPPRRAPRRPATALAALVLFSLLAAFFAWVSAEPLWLAVGHGDRGTATVTRCTGTGVGQRCTGAFTAADGRFTATRVALLGVGEVDRRQGAAVSARMVDRDSRRAYVGNDGLAMHLRWTLGLLLLLLCGAGIVWTTGARRLEDGRARRWAVLASLGGPVLFALGFLAAAW